MPDPNDNDLWADLYADLGVNEPAAKSPAPSQAGASDELAELDANDETELEADDDAAESEDGGEQAGSDEDEPGTKKRRRRRRRRKKKGPGEPGAAPVAGEASEDADAEGEGDAEAPGFGESEEDEEAEPAPAPRPAPRPAAVPARAEAPRVAAETEGDEEEAEDGEEAPGRAANDLEETSADAAREMIADWNVPSWSEIVAGLYRPER